MISIVIPTFGRGNVLIDTIAYLLDLSERADEILVIDQNPRHDPEIARRLQSWHTGGDVKWLRLPKPSIPHAMNVGLLKAHGDIVLFLDDDIVPMHTLVQAHCDAHHAVDCLIVAGQVLQPGELPDQDFGDNFSFCSNRPQFIDDFIGCNVSVKRDKALALGGFDERFVKVAYNFEAEFAHRVRASGGRIYFEPTASIRHLHIAQGGTRTFGSHLRTIRPHHAVGAYYFFLQGRLVKNRFTRILLRPLRAIRTRHHLTKPWWIPVTLIAEVLGLIWAIVLYMRGPKLLKTKKGAPE